MADSGFYQKETLGLAIAGSSKAEVQQFPCLAPSALRLVDTPSITNSQLMDNTVGEQRIMSALPVENVPLYKSLNYMAHTEALEKIDDVIDCPNSEFVLFTRGSGRVTLGAVTEVFNEKKVIRLALPLDQAALSAAKAKQDKVIASFFELQQYSISSEPKAIAPKIKSSFRVDPKAKG